MAEYGKLRHVVDRDFATELRACRERAPSWSRERLASESGHSLPGIEYIEKKHPTSKRETVIKLAWPLQRAGKWTVDAALECAGEPPLTTEEQRILDRGGAEDLRAALDVWWSQLPEPMRRVLVHVAAVLAHPEMVLPAPVGDDEGVEATSSGGATVLKTTTRRVSSRECETRD